MLYYTILPNMVREHVAYSDRHSVAGGSTVDAEPGPVRPMSG